MFDFSIILGGGALYPEIDQSGPTANGMSSKQHQSISFHFCLIFLSDRELLDCSNCAIPTNCQGEAKFHLRSVKVSRIESSWERISRLYTSWRHLGADNGSDSFFVLFLEPETLQNWLRVSRFPKFLRRKTNLMVSVQGRTWSKSRILMFQVAPPTSKPFVAS